MSEDVDKRGGIGRESDRFGQGAGADGDVASSSGGGIEEDFSDGGRSGMEESDRHHAAKQKKKEGRGSLLNSEDDHDRNAHQSSSATAHSHSGCHARHSSHQPASSAEIDALASDFDGIPTQRFKVEQHTFLPSTITVVLLAMRIEKKMFLIQNVMTELGMEDTRADLMLKFEDAKRICAGLNIAAYPDDDTTFDLHPRPLPSSAEEVASFPVRLPVVTIMGHMHHGKTTLLDKFWGTWIAGREAGGITQHISAVSVPITGREQDKGAKKGYHGIQKITLLDTPGHAAFTAMRSRGVVMADIVVVVVAADDGVMPQTREVISLVKSANADIKNSGDLTRPPVQMVVALNKMDKPDADPERVKRELLAAGVELEGMGGNVPCVHVSARSGRGLADLEETIVTLAERADLRAERDGLPEGYVIESKRDERWGNVATVLVKRGVLEKNKWLVAGTACCKVRHMKQTRAKGASVTVNGPARAKAFPGEPVYVAVRGDLPMAGDVVLGGTDPQSCRKAQQNRKRLQEERRLLEDAEQYNEDRMIEERLKKAYFNWRFEEKRRRRAMRLAADEGKDPLAVLAAMKESTAPNSAKEIVEDVVVDGAAGGGSTKKYLNVIIKADFSGSAEALAGAISSIGNSEAGVKVLSATAAELNSIDIFKAKALNAIVIGFNVTPSEDVLESAAQAQPTPIPVIVSDVIDRLVEAVACRVSALLPPLLEAKAQEEQ